MEVNRLPRVSRAINKAEKKPGSSGVSFRCHIVLTGESFVQVFGGTVAVKDARVYRRVQIKQYIHNIQQIWSAACKRLLESRRF
jgi:hypothetical protein